MFLGARGAQVQVHPAASSLSNSMTGSITVHGRSMLLYAVLSTRVQSHTHKVTYAPNAKIPHSCTLIIIKNVSVYTRKILVWLSTVCHLQQT